MNILINICAIIGALVIILISWFTIRYCVYPEVKDFLYVKYMYYVKKKVRVLERQSSGPSQFNEVLDWIFPSYKEKWVNRK